MKLVLNDDGPREDKNPLAEPPKIPIQKRILISKEPARQSATPTPEPQPETQVELEPAKEEQKILPQEDRPIKE